MVQRTGSCCRRTEETTSHLGFSSLTDTIHLIQQYTQGYYYSAGWSDPRFRMNDNQENAGDDNAGSQDNKKQSHFSK